MADNKKEKKQKDNAAKPKKLSRREFDEELIKFQIELCKLQEWVKKTGARAAVVFEGRDAAGKGGVIKRIMERVSPRVFRVVALPAPSDREKTQFYGQRYLEHFPAAGEIAIFDRSWYNRAGVERVMGFCTDEEARRFLEHAPIFEHMMTASGIKLIKYWFEVGMEEQERRFRGRIEDPRKHWKLSPMDLESHSRWYEYSKARDEMLEHTDTGYAPWHVVRADNKRKARLNCITHLLSQFPYEEIPFEAPTMPKRKTKNKYDDQEPMKEKRWIEEVF